MPNDLHNSFLVLQTRCTVAVKGLYALMDDQMQISKPTDVFEKENFKSLTYT